MNILRRTTRALYRRQARVTVTRCERVSIPDQCRPSSALFPPAQQPSNESSNVRHAFAPSASGIWITHGAGHHSNTDSARGQQPFPFRLALEQEIHCWRDAQGATSEGRGGALAAQCDRKGRIPQTLRANQVSETDPTPSYRLYRSGGVWSGLSLGRTHRPCSGFGIARPYATVIRWNGTSLPSKSRGTGISRRS